jgi:GDP-mannose 6-dehydrogenase
MEPQNVVVFGLGYVGCVTAACLASLGHRVSGVDKDENKVASILGGKSPFFEPGLEPIVAEMVRLGRLTATVDPAPVLQEADIALVCVGTPSARNGNLALDQLQRVFTDLQQHISQRRLLIVAVRSTVFPGTTEELAAPLLRDNPCVRVVSNPEFLREGVAVRDFREPSLLVVGGDDPEAVRRVAELYATLPVEPSLVSLRTAEMIKYCCNAFHALKISFANEVGTMAAQLGISPDEVMTAFCSDTRLNISPAYLKPGFAFGGSCLPKDLRALTYRALRMDLKLPLLESILPSNERHLERAVQQLLDTGRERIGIFGLAFKEDTDDLRESPIVAAIEQWVGKGKDIRIYDPRIRLDQIYGSNRSFVLRVLPHIGKLMADSVEEVLDWCDCVVLAQKPAPAERRIITSAGKLVIDLVGAGLVQAVSQ